MIAIGKVYASRKIHTDLVVEPFLYYLLVICDISNFGALSKKTL